MSKNMFTKEEIAEQRKRFGEAVRTRRKRLVLLQEELGECTGLHRTYISSIERGKRNVSLENIAKLATALQVPIAKLFSPQRIGIDKKTRRE